MADIPPGAKNPKDKSDLPKSPLMARGFPQIYPRRNRKSSWTSIPKPAARMPILKLRGFFVGSQDGDFILRQCRCQTTLGSFSILCRIYDTFNNVARSIRRFGTVGQTQAGGHRSVSEHHRGPSDSNSKKLKCSFRGHGNESVSKNLCPRVDLRLSGSFTGPLRLRGHSIGSSWRHWGLRKHE